MVGGLAGPAAVAANQGLRGQQKNTAVQEWTQWKQWALDHKDFEALRAERVDDWEKLNTRLESDEFAEEGSAKREANREEEEEKHKIAGDVFMKVASIAVLAFIGLCVVLGVSQ